MAGNLRRGSPEDEGNGSALAAVTHKSPGSLFGYVSDGALSTGALSVNFISLSSEVKQKAGNYLLSEDIIGFGHRISNKPIQWPGGDLVQIGGSSVIFTLWWLETDAIMWKLEQSFVLVIVCDYVGLDVSFDNAFTVTVWECIKNNYLSKIMLCIF